ncbi:MAG: hypothetical protein K1X56_11585 [Flavobacteriales bacterium]|nr:hypothetical protein [Flavobacteriales bacterium]
MKSSFLVLLFLLSSLLGFSSERDQQLNALKNKIAEKKALVVHVMIPLCDNKYQGIVPVNDQLGDGTNLNTNLYWGAGYGFRSYFKLKTDWKLVHKIANHSSTVLERVAFTKTIGSTRVIMVGDAFRGDQMKDCLRQFTYALAGKKKDSVNIPNLGTIQLGSDADLLIFSGHNGLMDDTLHIPEPIDNKEREAMVIACYSDSYFQPLLKKLKTYPLITTSGLLAPEAYVMHAGIEAWAKLKTANEIRIACGDAYYAKHPSSTQGGCRNLFRTGIR